MSIEFNEPGAVVSARPAKKASFLSRVVMKAGLAKTEAGAQSVMLVIAAVAFVLVGFMVFRGNQAPPPPSVDMPAV